MSTFEEHVDRSLRRGLEDSAAGRVEDLGDFTQYAKLADPDTEPKGVWFINVYEVFRRYGGPEEGGWWYDEGGLVDTNRLVNVTETEAHQIARDEWQSREDEAAQNEVPPAHSVMYRGGRYLVRAEQTPGVDWPAERPVYE